MKKLFALIISALCLVTLAAVAETPEIVGDVPVTAYDRLPLILSIEEGYAAEEPVPFTVSWAERGVSLSLVLEPDGGISLPEGSAPDDAVLELLSAGTVKDHDFSVSKSLVEGSCVQKGLYVSTCDDCSLLMIGAAYGSHSYKTTSVTEATCTAAGSRTRTCELCGKEKVTTIPRTSHSYGSWKTVTASTCVTAGTAKRTCSECGRTQRRDLPSTPPCMRARPRSRASRRRPAAWMATRATPCAPPAAGC